MEYWHDIITEKSWNLLQSINKKLDFIVIGGWAAYLWTKALKSKDIDIVVDFKALDKLKTGYSLKKNHSLKRYEIVIDEIDIDIYVPFYSKLSLPIKTIEKNITKLHGFKVVLPEILLILKQSAEMEREFTKKGQKDRLDILSLLLNADVDFKKYHKLLNENNLMHYNKALIRIMSGFKEYNYFNLNPRTYKLKKEKILKKLR